jgi:hypothetical protein
MCPSVVSLRGIFLRSLLASSNVSSGTSNCRELAILGCRQHPSRSRGSWLYCIALAVAPLACNGGDGELAELGAQDEQSAPDKQSDLGGQSNLGEQSPGDESVVNGVATARATGNAVTPGAPDAEPDAPGASLPTSKRLTRAVPTDVPRVYAKTRNVWIRGTPTYDTQWIGFLWWGDSVPLKSTEPVTGPGCETWYAVEPRGYVCVDGKRATLDPTDPVVSGTWQYAHDADDPNPHRFYGETTGAYRYVRLPTEKTQRAKEWDFRFRQEWIAKAIATGERAEALLGVDLTPATETSLALPELPGTLQMAHRELIPRSTVAWSAEVLHEGRSFLLTDDLSWVSKDRVKPYSEVEYQGIHLTNTTQLPLAMFRRRDVTAYRWDEAAERFVPLEKTYRRLSWTKLTGETRVVERTRVFHQTEHLDWVEEGDAVVPKPRAQTPWGATVGGEDTTDAAPRGRGTWIEVSILGGWLLAYEGTKPVFVTLMSPGKGGPPRGKIPLLETASSPTGRFKITGKFVTSTMIAPNKLVHSAVPWAQNFSGPYAIHGAYWHNDWGEPKSGGCINLSPKDAKWMYDFTEPAAPRGWHGVRWLPGKEGSTTLIITE